MKKLMAKVSENAFVEINQYDVAKYDKALNPPVIRGLYTTNLNTCLAIILYSKDCTKFLLVHTDTNVHVDSLLDHFAWFAHTEYFLHICKGKTHSSDNGLATMILSSPAYSVHGFIQRLEQSLLAKNITKWSESYMHQSEEGVAGVSINGEIILKKQHCVVKHPLAEKNLSNNMKRYFSKYSDSGMYALMSLYPVYESGCWYEYTTTASDMEYKDYQVILKELGNQLTIQAKYLAALGYYRQVIAINPDAKEIWFNMGLCFKKLNNFMKALDSFDHAIAIDSNYVKALWHKSEILIQQRLFQKALTFMELILKIDPNNADTLKLKEKCLASMQEQEKCHDNCSVYREEDDKEIRFLQALVNEVQKQILTSNDIIPRITCPYYFDHQLVPKALSNFKTRLIAFRRISSEKIASIKQVPIESGMFPIMGDFSMGSFSHSFVGALVMASFGIGECSECSAKLVIEMLSKNHGNFTFVGIRFINAQPNMEQTHQFIVVNLDKSPKNRGDNLSVYAFLDDLPQSAIIVDAFLGLVFKPNNIPKEFIAYINAYGGSTSVIQCLHLKNMGQRFLNHYLSIANKISRELREQDGLLSEENYDLDSKISIEDTSLIRVLNEKTQVAFFGVRNTEYQVDAIVEVTDKNTQIAALSVQDASRGYGRFFQNKKHGRVFVLEGINLPERYDIQEYIQKL